MAIESVGGRTPAAPAPAETKKPAEQAWKAKDSTLAKQSPAEAKQAAKTAFGDVPATSGEAPAAPPKDAKAPVAASPKLNIIYNHDAEPTAAPPSGSPPASNATLPPPKAPADAKETAAPEPSVADPAVDAALNAKTASGKTVADESSAKTMDDLRKYAKLQQELNLPDDEITLYTKYKMAEGMIKDGIPTGADPKDPRMPASTVYAKESTTYDVFDKEKIAAGVKSGEDSPVVQKWLADKQVYNQERILDEKIKNGEIADVPKDPATGLRTDYLKAKQKEFVNSPAFANAIAKMPPDKQQEAIQKSISTFMELGSTLKETREQLVNVISNVSAVTGQPTPVIDENFNFVTTGNGESIVKDSSGYNIALADGGKAVVDKNNGLPMVYGDDGKASVDVSGNAVQLDPSGNAVVVDGKTGDKNVFDKRTGGALINPDTGNSIIIDPGTGAAVEKNTKTGAALTEPKTGMPRVIDTRSGKALANPNTGNAIVADKQTGAAVEVDKASGKVVADKDGNPVIVDPKTGYQVWDRNGNKVVADKDARLAVVVDPKSGIKTIMNPKTAEPMLDPKQGVTAILDPVTKTPVAALTDKQTGELVKNPNGQVAHVDDTTGLPVVADPKSGSKAIVDPSNGYAVQDPKGNTLMVDKETGLAVAVGADGKDVVEANTGAKLIYDAVTGLPVGKPESGTYTVIDPKTGLAVEVDPSGQFSTDQATGKVVVMDAKTGKNMKTRDGQAVTIDARTGLPVAHANGKDVLVNPATGELVIGQALGAKVVVDPGTGMPAYLDPKSNEIYKDPASGGKPVVNPVTGEPMQDVNGNFIQVNPDTGQAAPFDKEAGKFMAAPPGPVPLLDEYGGQLTLPDGKIVARDAATGMTILMDPLTKQPVAEAKSGLTQIVDAKGQAMQDAAGNAVVIDEASRKPIAVDAFGKPVAEPKSGNTQIVDAATGKAVSDSDGNPVVLDKESDAPVFVAKGSGEVLKDKASGMALIADPTTGKAVTDPGNGNKAVLDPDTNAPVQVGADGKVVVDGNGQPYIVNAKTGTVVKAPNGAYVVANKSTGLPVVKDAQTGVETVVDPSTGEPVVDPKSGATLQVNKNTGIPELVKTNAHGVQEVIDPKTGKPKADEAGNLVYIDPATGQAVINDPLKGVVDFYTGMTPVVTQPPKLSDKDRQTFSAIKSANKAIYMAVFDFHAFDLTPALKEFKSAKLFGTAWAAAAIATTAAFWAPGTDRAKKLAEGDPATWERFSKDVLGIIKDDAYFVNSSQWLNNFLANHPSGALNTVKVAANGDIVKIGANGQYQKFVPGPRDAAGNSTAYWETLPANYNPGTAVQAPLDTPAGAVRVNTNSGGWEVFNANTGKWEKGSPFPVGPGAKPQEYYAAGAKTPAVSSKTASLFKTLGTAAKWLSIGASGAIGGINIYNGIKSIIDGAKDDNPMKIAAGAFHILSGVGYAGSAVATAFGVTGALGPGLMLLGYAAAFIATMIDIHSDPAGNRPEKEIWAGKVMGQFSGADVFHPDAKQKLEQWYNDWALPYWAEKASDAASGDIPDKPPGKYGPKWSGTR